MGRCRRYAVRCGSPWVIGVSVRVQRTRETYLQATTTCVIDATSTTQVVVGSLSLLGVLGMAIVSSALMGGKYLPWFCYGRVCGT